LRGSWRILKNIGAGWHGIAAMDPREVPAVVWHKSIRMIREISPAAAGTLRRDQNSNFLIITKASAILCHTKLAGK